MNCFSRKLRIILVIIFLQSSLGTNAALKDFSNVVTRNLGQNGYYKLPDGLMIQWGNLASSYRNRSIYLPTSFYDNKYIAIVGVYDSTVDSISVVSCKIKTQYTTYFVLVPVATYGCEYYVYATEGINWFAICRWK